MTEKEHIDTSKQCLHGILVLLGHKIAVAEDVQRRLSVLMFTLIPRNNAFSLTMIEYLVLARGINLRMRQEQTQDLQLPAIRCEVQRSVTHLKDPVA